MGKFSRNKGLYRNKIRAPVAFLLTFIMVISGTPSIAHTDNNSCPTGNCPVVLQEAFQIEEEPVAAESVVAIATETASNTEIPLVVFSEEIILPLNEDGTGLLIVEVDGELREIPIVSTQHTEFDNFQETSISLYPTNTNHINIPVFDGRFAVLNSVRSEWWQGGNRAQITRPGFYTIGAHPMRYVVRVGWVTYEAFCMNPWIRGPEAGPPNNPWAHYEYIGPNTETGVVLRAGFPANPALSSTFNPNFLPTSPLQAPDVEEDGRILGAYATRLAVALMSFDDASIVSYGQGGNTLENMINALLQPNAHGLCEDEFPTIIVGDARHVECTEGGRESTVWDLHVNRRTFEGTRAIFRWADGTPDGVELWMNGELRATSPNVPQYGEVPGWAIGPPQDAANTGHILNIQLRASNAITEPGSATIHLEGIHNQWAGAHWMRNTTNPGTWQPITFYVPYISSSATFEWDTFMIPCPVLPPAGCPVPEPGFPMDCPPGQNMITPGVPVTWDMWLAGHPMPAGADPCDHCWPDPTPPECTGTDGGPCPPFSDCPTPTGAGDCPGEWVFTGWSDLGYQPNPYNPSASCEDCWGWLPNCDINVDGEGLCPAPFERDHHEPTPPEPQSTLTTQQIRWFNIPTAFGEIKHGEGFSNTGNSTGYFPWSLERTREVFEVMSGIPETEFLYINVGGTEGTMEVVYEWVHRTHEFILVWEEHHTCPVVCEEWIVLHWMEVCGPCGGSSSGEEESERNLEPGGWDDDPIPPPCPEPSTGDCPVDCPPEEDDDDDDEPIPPGGDAVLSAFADIEGLVSLTVSPEGEILEMFAVLSECSEPMVCDVTCVWTEHHIMHNGPVHARTMSDDGVLVRGRFWTTHTFDFRYLRLVEGSYRVAGNAQIHNSTLLVNTHNVPQQQTITHQWQMRDGLNNLLNEGIEPGVADQNFGHGAMNEWEQLVDVGVYSWTNSEHCTWNPEVDNPLWESWAVGLGNTRIGQLFAQNEAISITIGHNEYVFTERNRQSTNPFAVIGVRFGSRGPINLHAAPTYTSHFHPYQEEWHAMRHVPISGYQGFYAANTTRNTWLPDDARRTQWQPIQWVAENVGITERLVNGLYNFVPFLNQNYLDFTATQVNIRNGVHPVRTHTSDDWYGNAVNPTDSGAILAEPNRVRLEYTNWQHNSGNRAQYDGPNPVIIHNPVSNIFAWAHDVPESVLVDQRIQNLADRADGAIVRHSRAEAATAPGRFYIDFDFQISIPNHGTFERYWHFNGSPGDNPTTRRVPNPADVPNSTNFGLRGIRNVPPALPGTRGPGFIGQRVDWETQRNQNNPYWLTPGFGPSIPNNSSGMAPWDVSKWINAKLIQFPFDVYFYGYLTPQQAASASSIGASGWSGHAHPGGNSAGFYPAGTWILLFDNQGQVNQGPDPYNFHFRVASHVHDRRDAEIRIVTEAINSPYRDWSTQARGDIQWYSQSEWNVNGQREVNYPGALSLNNGSAQPQSAYHAVGTVVTVDVVGRIGNVVVDDSADPAWTSVFWETQGGNPITNLPVNRGIATYFNMFESIQAHLPVPSPFHRPFHPAGGGRLTTPGGFINRFSTLSNWHNQDQTLLQGHSSQGDLELPYTLPIGRNPIAQFNEQTQKLGYENQVSIQTLGAYGSGEMWVIPRYFPIGHFQTATSDTERFYLFATDPFDAHGTMRMFWDSDLQFGNWQFGPNGTNMTQHASQGQGTWQPHFRHMLHHTLADTRAKVNVSEQRSDSFIAAQQRGSLYTHHIGDPAFIRVPTELRTFIGGNPNGVGSTVTKGRTGRDVGFWTVESSPGSHQDQAFMNAQRWHFRHSLPSTTQLIFHNQLESGRFEGRSTDQYIGVSFTFRTNAGNGLWDLAVYTGAHYHQDWTDPLGYYPDFNYPLDREYDEITFRDREGRGGGRFFWERSWMWPHRDPNHPHLRLPDWGRPSIPIIVKDYSDPAASDRTTIGTH